MTRKAVVTLICDVCGVESEPLKSQVTFGWDYANPDGWLVYQEPLPKCEHCDHTDFRYAPIGLGNDPLLKPSYPPIRHFCCTEHYQSWLAEKNVATNGN